MEPLVMIVEDEPGLRLIYRTILERQGLAYIESDNGQDAIEKLQELRPHILLLDILMPKSGGADVIDYIQKNPDLQHMYTVIISAHAGFKRLLEQVPAGEFLLKPVLPQDIRGVVERALRQTHV